jgi:hypothetical protein
VAVLAGQLFYQPIRWQGLFLLIAPNATGWTAVISVSTLVIIFNLFNLFIENN